MDAINRTDFRVSGGATSDSTYQAPRMDAGTHTLMTIDYAHHEIHAGSSFMCSATDTDLDIGQLLNITFTTPASTLGYCHMFVNGSCTSSALFEVLEAPTVTANSGTPLAVYNRNRASSAVTGCKSIATVPISGATLTSTVTVGGTVIVSEGIGVGKNFGASSTRNDGEIILKAATVYVFRITGVADNGLAGIFLSWYEHINKEA